MKNLDQDFKKLARRNKWKSRIVTASISLFATLVVIAVAFFWRNNYILQQEKMVSEKFNITTEISSPNTTYIFKGVNQGLLNGTYSLSAFKDLNGIPVSVGDTFVSYGATFGQNWNYGADRFFATTNTNRFASIIGGQKEPEFFKSSSTNQTMYDDDGMAYPQELETLDQLPKHLAEVAITFDKPYTYDEIQKMVPANLLTNWLWLGINAEETTADNVYIGVSTSTDSYSIGEPQYDDNGKLVEQNYRTMIGSRTQDGNYQLNDEMYADFVSAVKKSVTYPELKNLSFGSSSNGEKMHYFYPYRDAVKQIEKYPTLEKAKFSGIILTGKTENFAQLKGKSWVLASSVGATTEDLPYLKTQK
ncbi:MULTISPECIES: anti sigma factor C-terminal domain-containing protein [unclassified Lactococcus]|uniref:anti sigma factor C-terminal domain-containing protein n=1 Tax=unclassified Lactococcus TaxID=2643510 RepID=UPI00165066DA|nr:MULTISPECIES: anti sigma factor C-terminal domain-containing protein [unclassified Lactococcus]